MRMTFTERTMTWEELAELHQIQVLELKLMNPKLTDSEKIAAQTKVRIPVRSQTNQVRAQEIRNAPNQAKKNIANTTDQMEQSNAQSMTNVEIESFDERKISAFYEAVFQQRTHAKRIQARFPKFADTFNEHPVQKIPMPSFESFHPHSSAMQVKDPNMQTEVNVLDTKTDALPVDFEMVNDRFELPLEPLPRKPILYPNIPGVWMNQLPSSVLK